MIVTSEGSIYLVTCVFRLLSLYCFSNFILDLLTILPPRVILLADSISYTLGYLYRTCLDVRSVLLGRHLFLQMIKIIGFGLPGLHEQYKRS